MTYRPTARAALDRGYRALRGYNETPEARRIAFDSILDAMIAMGGDENGAAAREIRAQIARLDEEIAAQELLIAA